MYVIRQILITDAETKGCGQMMLRKLIKSHQQNECCKTITPCSYTIYGCTIRLPREKLDDHNKDELSSHFELTKQHIKKQEIIIKELESKRITIPSFDLTVLGGMDKEDFDEQNSVYQWNNRLLAWDRLTSLPQFSLAGNCWATSCGNAIITYNDNNCVLIYDRFTRKWFTTPTLLINRRTILCTCGQYVYSIGGCDVEDDEPQKTVQCIKFVKTDVVETILLQTMPSMNVGRVTAASVVVNNVIYIFGGKSQELNEVTVTSAECYAPGQRNEWVLLASSTIPRYHHVAVAVNSDTIWLMGGSFERKSLDIVEEYTISTNTWRILSWTLPHTRSAFAATYDRGSGALLLVGGWPLEVHRSVDQRNPDGTWDKLKPLPNGTHACGFC